jgi:hypothetical protein
MLSRRQFTSLLGLCPAALAGAAPRRNELIVCGWDEVYALDMNLPTPEKVWSWKAADRPDLPAHMRDKFRSTDECKPVDGGTRVLITSSSDGVALVERPSGKPVFYATAANAHSAESLPGGRIAVAASHRPDGPGDRLIVFDAARPEKELFHTELSWGHGVVWDESRRILWALSGSDLRAYRLEKWDSSSPALSKLAAWPLPDRGGHDLYAVPGSANLTVTSGNRCWLFDRDRRSFSPHPRLAERHSVKCINVNPVTGQTVYLQPDGKNWWTAFIRFLDPDGALERPGERLYKARWNVGSR